MMAGLQVHLQPDKKLAAAVVLVLLELMGVQALQPEMEAQEPHQVFLAHRWYTLAAVVAGVLPLRRERAALAVAVRAERGPVPVRLALQTVGAAVVVADIITMELHKTAARAS